MKGDFSRLSFDAAKQYSSVRMQQGRVHLDADWNEWGEMVLHRRRLAQRDIVGPAGGPQGNAGFKIEIADARSQKNHTLYPALLKPLQTLCALLFHQAQRHRALCAIIPHIATEDFAARR